MTDQTRARRMQEILNRTKPIFLHDSIDKIKQINLVFEQWGQQQLSTESLIETIHQHVHGMKGLALTLSYHQIDRICQEIITIILQLEDIKGLIWTQAELADLHQMIASLELLVHEATKDFWKRSGSAIFNFSSAILYGW